MISTMDVEYLIDVITSFIIIYSIQNFKYVLDILRIWAIFLNICENIVILGVINAIGRFVNFTILEIAFEFLFSSTIEKGNSKAC